jgi:hypothetical protein
MRLGPLAEPITTSTQAREALDACSLAFAVLGVLQAGIGVFISLSDVLQAGAWLLLSLLLRVSRSRWASVILLFAACVSLANSLANRSDGITGHTNLGLVALVLWIAARAVYASFALHHFSTPDTARVELASIVSSERCPRCGVRGAEPGITTHKWRCKVCGSWWEDGSARG